MERNVKTYSQFIAESKKWLKGVTDKRGNINKIRLDDTDRIRILEFIYEAGEEGRRYTDIVKYIVETLKGEIYHWKTHRGYASAQLTGVPGQWWGNVGSAQPYGILYKYCERNDKGRWVLTNPELLKYFMKSDFRGVLSDEARDTLKQLLYGS